MLLKRDPREERGSTALANHFALGYLGSNESDKKKILNIHELFRYCDKTLESNGCVDSTILVYKKVAESISRK